jgi:hypothetical protein
MMSLQIFATISLGSFTTAAMPLCEFSDASFIRRARSQTRRKPSSGLNEGIRQRSNLDPAKTRRRRRAESVLGQRAGCSKVDAIQARLRVDHVTDSSSGAASQSTAYCVFGRTASANSKIVLAEGLTSHRERPYRCTARPDLKQKGLFSPFESTSNNDSASDSIS